MALKLIFSDLSHAKQTPIPWPQGSFIMCLFIVLVSISLFLVLQPAVLFLRQAALFRSGQCWSPASGLPAHAGALRHISGDRHAHWDVCPGDYHTRAPCQRLVLHVAHRACRYFLTKQQKLGPTMSGTVFVAIDFGR